jgi:hypothetical protein
MSRLAPDRDKVFSWCACEGCGWEAEREHIVRRRASCRSRCELVESLLVAPSGAVAVEEKDRQSGGRNRSWTKREWQGRRS